MHNRSTATVVLSALLVGASLSACATSGDNPAVDDEITAAEAVSASEMMQAWIMIASDAIKNDPPAPGQTGKGNDQAGPTRASRSLAMVSIAMYDAVQSISGTYQTYSDISLLTTTGAPDSHAKMSAAIPQAAHDVLVSLFPTQAAALDTQLRQSLKNVVGSYKNEGIARGKLAAKLILQARASDHSQEAEPSYATMRCATGSNGKTIVRTLPNGLRCLQPGKGQWAPDISSTNPTALGGNWMSVKPFAVTSIKSLSIAPPAGFNASTGLYDDGAGLVGAVPAAEFTGTEELGGDGSKQTSRTPDDTITGVYWGYDGAVKIGTPPRLYNQITIQVAQNAGLFNKPQEFSRVLAAVNVAMADVAIATWYNKYKFNLWRPINAIRSTPIAQGGDPTWTPLGAQQSNTTNPDFTPPFPSYPSGHAGFGGAVFQVLRDLLPAESEVGFTFVSDEFNGKTTDQQGNVRPLVSRHFTFDEAETQNARSRIFLGVHWQEDADAGVQLGNEVADAVVANTFKHR